MSWKREREGLIAQTLAFVQSVTGKGGERTAPQAIPPLSSEREATARPSVGSAALLAVETALGAPPPSAAQGVTPKAAPQRFDPQRFELERFELERFEAPKLEPPSLEPPSLERPSPEQPRVQRANQAAPAPILQRPIPQSEMASEIRARIASFRAHQERFNREREEYFAATLARLRASLRDAPPPPRLRK
jgi:hypothetical protein